MSTATLECCDLCGAPMESRSPNGFKTSFGGRNGLVVTLGYSFGGWGCRQNATDFSGEVCAACFADAQAMFEHVKTVLQNCRRRQVDNVQPVRTDEPQLERRGTPVLRAMREALRLGPPDRAGGA